MIDTHCHLDGEEFAQDLETVITRAREAGVEAIGVPGIDLKSCQTVLDLCHRYEGYCFPMLGLHPEEVKSDWREVLSHIRQHLPPSTFHLPPSTSIKAIGEVGLDFYWSREFEHEQLEAFEEQVRWAVDLQLPLMIHCRKAQNELVNILKRYKDDLPGGVFHCFTGNELEARELLSFDRFVPARHAGRGRAPESYRARDRCPLYGASAHAWPAQRASFCGSCVPSPGRGLWGE